MRRLALFAIALFSCAKTQTSKEVSLGPAPPKEVRRVVTLAPSLTELVLALGAKERLVGVTRYDDAPEVKDVTRVGGYSDPSAETILLLHPDLVLAQPSPGNKGAVEVVAESGIAVRVFPLETLGDVETTTAKLGALLARDEAAKELVKRIEDARAKARDAAKARGKPVRVAVLYDTEPIIAAGPGSFADELLHDAGAENVVARAAQPYPQVPAETLLAHRPDVILVAPMAMHGGSPQALPEPLRARVRVLSSEGILHPGPGVVDALGELTKVLDETAKEPR